MPVLAHRRVGWLLLLTISLGLVLTACKDDDASPASDALINTWTLSENGYIEKDDADITSDYTGFSITFTAAGVYTTQHANDLIPATGTWQWTDDEHARLLIDGNWPVSVTSLTADHAVFTFTRDDGVDGGRTSSLAGQYELSLYANH